ncbi:MAG: membrane dipeptidase, partial [Clostridia bacterium]|nr:membrane dipeptidase [Clostridia bacterium]
DFCGNTAEWERSVAAGKNPCLLSIEGSAALCGDLEKLSEAYELGVRLVTITWNGACEAGDGCIVPHAKGLTAFGKQLIAGLARRHMIIDVSHLSDAGFYDVAQETSGAFIASHSNSRRVCGHPRNLTDEQFCEIVRRGGLVGLNFYTRFLREDAEHAVSSDILGHVEHFLELGGENALAIGADFDGASMPEGITGAQDMTKVYELLSGRYSQRIADKIFFGNASEFIKTALTDCKNCNTI